MQRMDEPVVDRAAGRDERLARDLATEDALTILVGADATKQIHLELFELEDVDEVVERSPHVRRILLISHPKKTAAVS